MSNPADIAIHPITGDIYIADQGNNRIRKVDSNGVITTVAGNGSAIAVDDVLAIFASLVNPAGIAFDTAGNLYIADTGHHRIRRVDGVTGIITTVAGTGDSGYNGDGRSATSARLNFPDHVALDSLGNLFIADDGNNRIRRVDASTQIISTVAGTGDAGDNGDEQLARLARLTNPHGVMVDPAGNLFISDTGNHRVRFVDPSGVIHALAGTGAIGDSGDGESPKLARLRAPIGLGRDAAGNIYIADSQANRVRQVNASATEISTVAGKGIFGYSGDGGPAELATLSSPYSATINDRGWIYIAGYNSDVVRVVDHFSSPATIEVVSGSTQSTAVGSAFSRPLVVAVKDITGSPLLGIQVTFSKPPPSGASASLLPGTVVTTDLHGQASVNATANTVVGSYTVSAAVSGLAIPAVFNLTNTTGAAATIRFLQQPSNASAGAFIAPPVTVSLKDGYNNPIVGAPITLTADGLQGGAPQTTDSSGVATFTSLKITKAGTYQLRATGGSLTVSSSSFNITAGSQISIAVLSGGGQSASVGGSYGVPLKATVQDTFGNPLAGVAVTFTAPATGPSVTFSGSGTVTTDSVGDATSPGMTANGNTGSFQVMATTAGAPFPASFTLVNVAGASSKLAFIQQPTDTAAGVPMTPAVTVQLQDSFGNNVSTAGIAVTLQANPASGRTSGFTALPVESTDAHGLATFSGLTFAQAGQFSLLAQAPAVTSATSVPFTIHAGAPSTIQATGGTPQSALIQTPFAQQLKAKVLDSSGNPVSGVTVTFTVPSSGPFANLSAPSAVTNAIGEASVTATANSVAGNYSVTAATAGVTGNVSFSLTNLTGSVGHIAFVQKPSNSAAGTVISPPVTVRVTDAGSNPINGASVTISVQGGTPALGGTLSETTNASGVATFADLSITVAGHYRLEAVSSGMSVASDSFQVSAATSAVVVLAFQGDGQSAAVGTTYSGLLLAKVEDLYHNPIANASVTFAAPTNGASVTFSGSATVTSGADGVATAPSVTANSQPGSFQVTANTTAASGPAFFNLTNLPGAANKLAFLQQPVDTVAGATIAPAVTVQVQDSLGNAVHTSGIAVTLQPNATVRRLKELSGTTTQSTDSNGVATFADLSISQAGNYVLQAASTGLASVTSNAFKIAAGAAAKIQATGGTPQSTAILSAFAQPLEATVLDLNNNPVGGVTVTFTAPSSGASATLSGVTAITDLNGHAIVNATANSGTGGYSVTAAAAGVTGNASFSLTNTTGSPGQISFIQPPSNAPAGVPISPPVTVSVVDAGSNPVGRVTVTIHVRESAAPLGGTLSTVTNSSGVATFADLSITAAGTYQLEVVSGSLSAVSNPFTISAATSAVVVLAFQGDGQSAAEGTNYSGPLVARVEDLYHNPIANASVTFIAPTSGASVTFSGPTTVTSDANGLATSPAMTANSQTGTFQVMASTAGASGPAAFNLTIVPGNANKLAFVQQPVDTAAGAAITPAVVVQVQDNAGNPVHTSGIAITLQANATVRRLKELSGIATESTDANGLATFANLSISQAGTYTLQANSSGLGSATSNPFKITVGTAASIQATGGTPQIAVIVTPFAQPLQVTVLDAFNNPVSGAAVTFGAPGSGASATLSASSALTDVNGIAAVTATANSVAGGYSVTAATAGAAAGTSFALTNAVGTVGQIVFVQQPANTQAGAMISPPVTVRATDAGSNPISGASITISVQGGSATLGGTLTVNTNASGVATFADLSLTTAGSYQLLAVSGSMSAVSNVFQISSASSAVISAFEGDGQSAPVGAPYGGPLKAKVQDLYGNPLPGASVTFVAPASGASATFGGPATVTTGADGIAVSPAITANSLPGTFQITATTPNSTTPAAFNLTNVAGSANRLAFVVQPSDTGTGATISPSVTVQLQDASGNAVHMAGVPVAIQANAVVQKQLAGSRPQTTDANGLATFADLSISQAGSYTLQATSSGLGSATSNPFKITADLPASIVATAGTPQNAIVQTVFGVPLQATVTDTFGNPISGVMVVFTAPASGPSGLFGGQSTISVATDVQGRASAIITANNVAGTYGVTASSTAVTGSAVFTLTNLPPATGALAFVQQPGNTGAGQVIAPPVTVQVVDAAGHPVSVSGVPIIMSLAAGTGTLSGSLVQLTDATGTATFGDLSINQIGSKGLRAIAQQQLPVNSNVFQITAGPPANIVLYGGSPQSTTVGQPFPEPLQALVTDALGDPVSGVSVIFSLPVTGPSGTFGGSPMVTTGADGIATSATLVANSTAGIFVVTATATGVGGAVQYSLTSLPQQIAVIVATPSDLSFVQEVGQPAPQGQTVQITTTGQTPINWTSSSSASWLTAVPASGTTPDLTVVNVNPTGLSAGVYTGSISLIASSGAVSTVLVTYAINSKPTLVISPSVLAFITAGNSLPAPQNLLATSSSRSIAYAVSIQVSTPPGGTWLTVSPNSGQTIGTVAVTADPTGLSQGIYGGSVLFTPLESGLNSVAVPVTLVVGCAQGGCIQQPIITAVVNGASFHPTGAPGAIMTIFGANFSNAVYTSPTYPLPTVLGQTSVSVDGIHAPLYYVSPTQINFQMPSGVLTSGGNVVVNNGAPGFRASSSYKVALGAVDPGIFVTTDRRAAALNGDLTTNTPANPAPAGGYIILYLTGPGPVTPPVADGVAAPAEPLSFINSSVLVTIGAMNAQMTFQGLAPGFAGLAQLNVIVPAGLPPGDQPAFVSINGFSSNVGLITVK